ncbi:MAG: hypothetical protein LBJ74_03095 [Heliobacteriaceae bacterium]|jgi:hypothetical protein|nr:hypothetical protein [Heliobacteriaceae bacterium]
MYKNLKDEKLIVEITGLVGMVEKFDKELDGYCQFMKEMFLKTSGTN